MLFLAIRSAADHAADRPTQRWLFVIFGTNARVVACTVRFSPCELAAVVLLFIVASSAGRPTNLIKTLARTKTRLFIRLFVVRLVLDIGLAPERIAATPRVMCAAQ